MSCSRWSYVLVIFYLIASPAFGQVSFTAWQPVFDSFPVVRIPISVSDSGRPAQAITPANFTVKEDGIVDTPLTLTDCSGSPSAAIVFVVDTSSSMDASVGSGPQTNRNYQKFFNGFSGFISSIPAPSQVALVEFGRTASTWPGAPRWFFNSDSTKDTTDFLTDLRSGYPPSLYSGTNVDSGIVMGATVLAHSTITRRIMVLVTDDSPDQADSIRRYLLANGITLYFMDVNRDDSNKINYAGKDLAEATDGAYFQAYDTNLYVPTLQKISQLIFGEKCLLRYVSTAKCPWWKSHSVEVDLNYQGATPKAQFAFALGGSRNDKNPPTWTVDSTIFTKRVLTTYDRWPCESGMYTFLDSLFRNFRHPRLPVVTRDSATDSLIVIDSLQPADGYFTATDTAQNKTIIHVHYDPKPDVLAPVIDSAQSHGGGGVITMNVTEQQPWDRGIKSVSLQPGAANLMLDSILYFANRWVVAYLRIPNFGDSSGGCLLAVDSFNNSSTLCYSVRGTNASLPASSETTSSITLLDARLLDNPMNGEIALSYVLGRTALVRVELRDILGRILPIANAKYLLQEPGSHVVRIPVPNLPSGTFYLRVSTDTGDLKTLKVVKE